jgi:hypothetical protein
MLRNRVDVGATTVGWLGRRSVRGDSAEVPAIHSAESIIHYRTLRERLERRLRSLETHLPAFRWDLSLGIWEDLVTERRHERLLRLRRLLAKLASRERLAAGGLASPILGTPAHTGSE